MEVVFRADANETIGGGHVMRCLALALFFKSKGMKCTLLTYDSGAASIKEWYACGLDVDFLEHSTPYNLSEVKMVNEYVANQVVKPWIVLDGYDFDSTYMQSLKEAQNKLLVLDDIDNREITADIILNTNVGADGNFDYATSMAKTYLLGERYAILRDEIRHAEHVGGAGLLVTLGSSDEGNLGLRVLNLLKEKEIKSKVHLISGADEKGLAQVKSFCEDNPDFSYSPVGKIIPYMVSCDAALCAGGVTASELASLGIASSILVLADNQKPGAERIAELGAAYASNDPGAAVDAACTLIHNPAMRRTMQESAQKLIDGCGPARIYETLINHK